MCGHCGERPAFYAWPSANGGAMLLCIDCSEKVRRIEEQSLRQQEQNLRHMEMLERQADHAADEMDYVMGLPPSGPRFRHQPRRQAPPVIQAPGAVFNNINVNNSVVGAINTGTAHAIDVKITQLREAGSEQLATAIRDLTQAILATDEITATDKDEALQAIEVVATEARKPQNERKLGLVRPLLAALGTITAKSADLLQIWQAAKPVIGPFFGIDTLS